ncbi:GntR family transcriptional regulator [Psychrobacillus lasiicapitis]|uniref:GntR family transcriptional regulator n=1 Tax=Psychrobacillus lasiicapitis TaxID=1636719 RepID=A0A544TGQ5_9BACI|nr:GntR family transcriptional regulator [Psychrobacillus lasiicapitis]TQR16639.1 GntR family transcriptional regulator [Psychrobacillus lasiicapitis]GGA28467.1 GntR family transcriptional regulator [Psychrobacillus lasiicapitis]
MQIRKLVKDNAYLGIKERIIGGELAPDQILTEDYLTNLLQISRTPLREAIQRLEFEEFIFRQPNGRFKVSSISKENAIEIYQMRGLIEGFIVRNATVKATSEDIKNLETIIEKTRLSILNSDPQSTVLYGNEFHGLLYNISDMHIPIKFLSMLNDHSLRYRLLISKSGVWYPNTVEEHQTVVEYMKQRNIEAAEMTIKLHIEKSLNSLLKKFNQIKRTD